MVLYYHSGKEERQSAVITFAYVDTVLSLIFLFAVLSSIQGNLEVVKRGNGGTIAGFLLLGLFIFLNLIRAGFLNRGAKFRSHGRCRSCWIAHIVVTFVFIVAYATDLYLSKFDIVTFGAVIAGLVYTLYELVVVYAFVLELESERYPNSSTTSIPPRMDIYSVNLPQSQLAPVFPIIHQHHNDFPPPYYSVNSEVMTGMEYSSQMDTNNEFPPPYSSVVEETEEPKIEKKTSIISSEETISNETCSGPV